MRVLTWNLFHGRAVPPAGRDLIADFSALIAGWEWDIALLQEVPPWWPPRLARDAGAVHATALTSRNFPLCVRRPLAQRWPDLIKSSGGGANAILARGDVFSVHARRRLRWTPERRVVHAVRLERAGVWAANLHAQVHPHVETRRDVAMTSATIRLWAGAEPVILGGDFNVTDPAPEGFERAGGRGVDHVFTRELGGAGTRELPDRGRLSDHPAVIVTLPQ